MTSIHGQRRFLFAATLAAIGLSATSVLAIEIAVRLDRVDSGSPSENAIVAAHDGRIWIENRGGRWRESRDSRCRSATRSPSRCRH